MVTMPQLTTKEAATRAAVGMIAIRQNIARGNLKATKRGRDWFIDSKELDRWLKARQPKGGRPKK